MAMNEAEYRERKLDRHKIAALQGSLKAVADDIENLAKDRDMHDGLKNELRQVAAIARLSAR